MNHEPGAQGANRRPPPPPAPEAACHPGVHGETSVKNEVSGPSAELPFVVREADPVLHVEAGGGSRPTSARFTARGVRWGLPMASAQRRKRHHLPLLLG